MMRTGLAYALRTILYNAVIRLIVLILGVAGTVACNTSLSDDQRKALREEMDRREIKKVSEHEIYRQALSIGKSIAKEIDPEDPSNWPKDEDIAIKVISTADPSALTPTELKIWLAYSYAPKTSTPDDNIQKDGDDHLIYSKPLSNSDSTYQLLLIRIAQKKVVLSL